MHLNLNRLIRIPEKDPGSPYLKMVFNPSDDFGRLAWLTGFSGSNGMAVITQNDAVLWTDGRYSLQAGGE
jgi:Xaa-Pro aminopeptidase